MKNNNGRNNKLNDIKLTIKNNITLSVLFLMRLIIVV